jgi:hypothetical protein
MNLKGTGSKGVDFSVGSELDPWLILVDAVIILTRREISRFVNFSEDSVLWTE